MKRFVPYLIGIIATLALLAAFGLGQASAAAVLASTGCFSDTNGHWAETAICWAAEKGIVGGFPDGTYKPNNNVTRAQVAVMIKNQATVGSHYFNAGPNAWEVNSSSSNAAVERYTVQAFLTRSTAGSATFQVTPTLPATLYSSTTRFTGVQFCYKTEADAIIDTVGIVHSKFMVGDGSNITLSSLTDSTDRTGYGCRVYSISSPNTYYPDNLISFFVTVNFPTSSAYVRVYSTTFILTATDIGPGTIWSMPMPGLPQTPASEQISTGPESGE
jgi:hypothetical protein